MKNGARGNAAQNYGRGRGLGGSWGLGRDGRGVLGLDLGLLGAAVTALGRPGLAGCLRGRLRGGLGRAGGLHLGLGPATAARLGRRGLGALRGMLGSVSFGVLRSVDVPVLTVK